MSPASALDGFCDKLERSTIVSVTQDQTRGARLGVVINLWASICIQLLYGRVTIIFDVSTNSVITHPAYYMQFGNKRVSSMVYLHGRGLQHLLG